MNNEEMQILLSEFNRQFDSLKKELDTKFNKLSDGFIILREANISTSKDIEAVRAWNENEITNVKEDINQIGQTVRDSKKDILKSADEKIKNGNLTTRLIIAGSYITAFGALIMLFISKKLGG